jgi:LacI family transcriptional regulator
MGPVRRRPAPGTSVTKIGDVAEAAGVSAATVSRVLNGRGNVSAELSERVRQVAAELDYQPFGPARALRQQVTPVWAVVIADIENPFFTAMVRGVEDVAVGEEHRVVLCNSDEDLGKEAAYLNIVIAERMSGVVIAVASTDESDLEPLLERNVPVVAVDRRPVQEGIDSVLVDNRLGGEQATAHLIDAGCRRIGCITGPTRLSTAAERLAGYRDALASRMYASDTRLVRRADFKERGGFQATKALLESPEPPDAVFVTNNLMTIGAVHAIREAGLEIPRDIALVGFDDEPWTTLTRPQLTVVAQPTYEIGRQAAQLLASAPVEGPARHVVLPPTLIPRESTVFVPR